MMNLAFRDQFASLWARRGYALGAARRARTSVTAVAGFALVVLTPHIARADVSLSDNLFTPAYWTLWVSAAPGGTVTASTIPTGGTPTSPPYRRVNDVVGAAGGFTFGVHIFVGPGSTHVGTITSIDASMNRKCIICPGSGQAYGVAIAQMVGNNTYYYRSFPPLVSGQSMVWSSTPPVQTGLVSTDFYLMNGNGTWNTAVHPTFTNPDAQTRCGFYTGNSGNGGYTSVAGYDDWACVIHTPKVSGTLKICKVAGPGVAVGTPFNFTAGPFSGAVPAGPAPGGYCVIGPSLPVGTVVNVQEAVPPGIAVAGIVTQPASQSLGVDLGAGIDKVTIGSGVTEVTYTDRSRRFERTGYLEICKRGAVKGSFAFTVNPGALGPFTVPAGACSPAIEVIAGTVTITELPNSYGIIGSATLPASRQLTWNATSSTVSVVPGSVSTQTVVMLTNGKHR